MFSPKRRGSSLTGVVSNTCSGITANVEKTGLWNGVLGSMVTDYCGVARTPRRHRIFLDA